MYILEIEHEVFNFDAWKKAFENDPIDRKKAGVRRYSIHQGTDNPKFVVIHLTFDQLSDANRTLDSLKNLWKNIEGKVMINPQVRILKMVESREL